MYLNTLENEIDEQMTGRGFRYLTGVHVFVIPHSI